MILQVLLGYHKSTRQTPTLFARHKEAASKHVPKKPQSVKSITACATMNNSCNSCKVTSLLLKNFLVSSQPVKWNLLALLEDLHRWRAFLNQKTPNCITKGSCQSTLFSIQPPEVNR